MVEEAKPEELPWCAMAILHIMAVPASDADTSNAALALLDACSACPDSVVQTALRGALHAAMQRQPRCAGELAWCLIAIDPALTGCLVDVCRWRAVEVLFEALHT